MHEAAASRARDAVEVSAVEVGDGDFVVVEVGCGDTEAVTELVPPAAAVADGVALTDGVVLRDGELETVAAVGAVGAEAVPRGRHRRRTRGGEGARCGRGDGGGPVRGNRDLRGLGGGSDGEDAGGQDHGREAQRFLVTHT